MPHKVSRLTLSISTPYLSSVTTSPQILSVEAAELAREQQRASSLDEDSLGRLEEDIKDLGVLLSTASPLVRQHTATTTHHTRDLCPLDITSQHFLSMLSVL
jgi:hypothetical protein